MASLQLQNRLASSSATRSAVQAPVVARISKRTPCFTSVQREQQSVQQRSVQSRASNKVVAVAEILEEQDEALLKLPAGYHWYETMLVLRPTMNEEERDRELAKFEAFLNKEECQHINALVRPRSRMAYPMQGQWEGIYVLYTYAARRATAKTVQLLLSNPEAGSEENILRHITFCKY